MFSIFSFRYMIDIVWMNQWKTYVGLDEYNPELAGVEGQKPDPIDNSGLFTGTDRVLL